MFLMFLNYFKNNLSTVGILIPIIASIFGVIIINIFLNQYGLVEYSIFQIQSILTGSVYLIGTYILINVSYLIISFCNESKLLIGFASVFIAFIEASFFWGMIVKKYNNVSLWGLDFSIEVIDLLLFISLFSLFFSLIYKLLHMETKKISLRKKIILIAAGIILSLPTLFICLISLKYFLVKEGFFGIFLFFLLYPVLVGSWVTSFPKDKTKSERGINTGSTLKKKLAFHFLIILSLITVINTTNLYATKVYPYFSKNFGGGKSEYVQVFYSNEKSIKGNLIHSNSNLIFIKENNIIKILEWNKIESIQKQ